MSEKKSIFLSTGSVEWIHLTTQKDGPKWSEAINSTIRQIRYLTKRSVPELTIEEWEVLIDVYKDVEFPAYAPIPWIARDIMYSAGALSIESLNPEHAALVKKMDTLTDIQQLAILYVIQIYKNEEWHYKGECKVINDDIIRDIKLLI